MTWFTLMASNVVLILPLALAAWGIQRWGRRYAVARILWVIVLLKLLTPPLVSVSFNETSTNPACRDGSCGCPQHRRSVLWDACSIGLLAAWGIGATTTGCTAWRRWFQFERLLAHADPAPREWQIAALELSEELRVPRCPIVLAVPGPLPPMVVPGWRELRLLVPLELVHRLNESQRDVLLLHELTHIRRRDHWVRFLELGVRVVYWWLPVVGKISRELRSCEEICCDASVVTHRPDARRDYATLLLDVIDLVAPPMRAFEHATGMNTLDDIELRLRSILHGQFEDRRSPLAIVVAILALGVIPWSFEYDWSRIAAAETNAPDAVDVRNDAGSESCAPAEKRDIPQVLSSLGCAT